VVTWEAGDLALCVNVMPCDCGAPLLGINVGQIYRVESMRRDELGGWLYLPDASVVPHFCVIDEPWFAEEQFRKILPDKHEACEAEFVTLLKRQRVSA
jgi:hypothetical protein